MYDNNKEIKNRKVDDKVFFKLYMEWIELVKETYPEEKAKHYMMICEKYIIDPLAVILCRSIDINHLNRFMSFVLTNGRMKNAEKVAKTKKPAAWVNVSDVREMVRILNEILEYGAERGYMDSFFFVLYDERPVKELPEDVFIERLANRIRERSGAAALSVYGRSWIGKFSLLDQESGERKSWDKERNSFYSFKKMVEAVMNIQPVKEDTNTESEFVRKQKRINEYQQKLAEYREIQEGRI